MMPLDFFRFTPLRYLRQPMLLPRRHYVVAAAAIFLMATRVDAGLITPVLRTCC